MSFVVKAVAATVLLDNGGRVLLYQGQPVPEGADKDDVARLKDEGYLAESEDAPKKETAAEKKAREKAESEGQ